MPEHIIQSARTDSSNWSSRVCLNEVPSTVTRDTMASPIISAEAVVAVRRGLRAAFSRARRPFNVKIRAAGHPSTSERGPATAGLQMLTPSSMHSAPRPMSRMIPDGGNSASRPTDSSTSPVTPTTDPTMIDRRWL